MMRLAEKKRRLAATGFVTRVDVSKHRATDSSDG
jgi:hypothetical protein